MNARWIPYLMPFLKPPLMLVGLLAALSGIWHALMVWLGIKTYFMPMPLATWQVLIERWPLLKTSLYYTLAEAGVGLVVSLALSVIVAGVCVNSRSFTRATMPFAIAMRSVPIVALAPLITLMVGRGFATGVIVVVICTFFALFVNSMRGFQVTRKSMLELAYVYGASSWQTFFMMRLPFALPHLFAGLRATAPAAVLGAMIAEWLTGSGGLGYLILDSAATRELEQLWAAIIVTTVLAMSIFWLTAEVERWLLRRTT